MIAPATVNTMNSSETIKGEGLNDESKSDSAVETGERRRGIKTGLLRRMLLFGKKESSERSPLVPPKPLVETVYEGVTANVALELSAQHVDILLTKVMPTFSRNTKLIKTARSLSFRIGTVRQAVGKRIGGVDLEEIAVLIEMLLSTTKGLPGSVVAYVYTCLGMIRKRQKRYENAIDALVKALWIRLSAAQPPELIAVASHRLGAAYALNDDKENAIAALKRAIQYYSSSTSISMDHELVVATQNRLFILKNFGRPSSERVLLKKAYSERGDTETVKTADVTAGSWTDRGSRSHSQP